MVASYALKSENRWKCEASAKRQQADSTSRCPRSKPETNNRQELSSAFPNRIERFDQNFAARLCAEIAFAVDADADSA